MSSHVLTTHFSFRAARAAGMFFPVSFEDWRWTSSPMAWTLWSGKTSDDTEQSIWLLPFWKKRMKTYMSLISILIAKMFLIDSENFIHRWAVTVYRFKILILDYQNRVKQTLKCVHRGWDWCKKPPKLDNVQCVMRPRISFSLQMTVFWDQHSSKMCVERLGVTKVFYVARTNCLSHNWHLSGRRDSCAQVNKRSTEHKVKIEVPVRSAQP